MTRALKCLAIAVGLAASNSANATRTIEYPTDAATWTAWAAEQDVPLAQPKARTDRRIRLDVKPAVDHDVIRVGIICSVWDIENPMAKLVQSMFGASASDPRSTDAGLPVVSVESATTVSRCIGTGELKSTCITRVTLKGSVESPGAPVLPLAVTVELPTRGVGVCAGLTRGIALVSRNAVRAFIDKVDQSLGLAN